MLCDRTPGRRAQRALARLTPLLSLSILFTSARAHATTDAVLQGTVYDEVQRPIEGAVVVLHDAGGVTVRSLATAKDGGYVFHGIPFGDYTVEASAPDRVENHQHVRVMSAETQTIDLYCLLPRFVSHVVERPPEVKAPPRATGSVQSLDRAALATLPAGEDRAITDVLATQAGFVGDAFGNVYVRGNHANVQYQLDGVPIPDSVGSLFAQALPVRLIQNLEILTGGMPAEFGDRLAAVVNVSTRHASSTPEGTAQVRYGSFQTVEPSLTYSRTLGPVGVFIGGSVSSSERALDAPSITPILHDDGETARLFLRLDAELTPRDRVELFASYAYNHFQIPIDPTVVPLDPAHPELVRPVDMYGNASAPYVPHDTDATETEHELFATASWVHRISERAQLQVAPFYKVSYGALASDPAHALGPLADPGATTSDVTRRADHLGAVLHFSTSVGGHHIKAGAQTDYLLGSTDFALYTRDDAARAWNMSATTPGTDNTSAILSGAYLQDRWDRGPLAVQMGVRIDEQHVALASSPSSDQVGVSPRLGVSLAATPDVSLHAFAGVLWQPPAPLDAGNAARVLGVVPASESVPYDVTPETDLYGELGVDGRAGAHLRLGATGWGRYAWNQLDDVAIGATNLIANYNFRNGRAVGAEGRAELVVGYWLSAFANVSWEIAQGQGIASAKFLFTPSDLANTAWQTLDHAQTLTANAGATVRERSASFTLLGSYGSGLRTGAGNDQTVPAHVRIDATLQYAFRDVPLHPTVAIDIVNLLDAHYAFRIANGFVGSSYAAPRSVFLRLVFPLGGKS